MIRQITEVRLLSVPLESDYKQTLYFESKENQRAYFESKTMFTGSGFQYQRKDGYIRWDDDYDSLIGCNYVMYRNTDYSDKWYYGFITKIEYVSDGVSRIYFETDVIQTWLFDYVVQPSFVEREHTDFDVIGQHTIPESLEHGEYIVDFAVKNDDLLERTIIIACTVDLNSGNYGGVAGNSYGGVYSGVRYYAVSSGEANNIISALASEGKSDAMTGIFEAPSSLVEVTETGTYGVVGYREDAVSLEWTPFNKPTKLNGYTPRNKKLLTYPYCYLLMSNNSGVSAVYHYELMGGGDTCDFKIHGVPTPGYSIRLIPEIYNGIVNNNLEGLNMGKYPVCSWATDVYTHWLTQNAVNIDVGMKSARTQQVLGGIGGVASLFTLNPAGVMGSVQSMACAHQQIGSIMGE